MSYFLIHGDKPLKGSVNISGSRDAAISMIMASLLTSEEVHLTNVPNVESVQDALDYVRSLGVGVEELEGEVHLQADEVEVKEVSEAIVSLGPLLARFGKVKVNLDSLLMGDYSIDRHLEAFELLGAEISRDGNVVNVKAERLIGAPIRFEKSTVLGTENAILAGVLASGETTIFGAACEPEVGDLIGLLREMGAEIERDSDDLRKIVIKGVEKLTGTQYEILPDRNEAVFFAAAAAATRGDITLEDIRPQDLTAFFSKFQTVGAGYEVLGDKIRVWADSDVEFQPVVVETAPHPGFMSAWQAPFSVLLAQAAGESLIHETVYLRRFGYLEELAKMGVRAEVLTPGEAGSVFDAGKYGFDWPSVGRKTPSSPESDSLRSKESNSFPSSSEVLPAEEPKAVAKINGPTTFNGTEVWVTNSRSGAALVVAALAADGESRVLGVEHIDRDFENIDEKLRSLGAQIERVD